MTHATAHRRLVTPHDTETAATVLARAFAHDPLWLALVPQSSHRLLALRQFFRATLPFVIQQRIVWGVGAPLLGVAIWHPPHALRTPWPALLNAATATLLASPFLRMFAKALPIFAQFERIHQQYIQQPHYYLSTIGVVPEAQGRGYASQLLRPVLNHADSHGIAIYTETMTPANVPVYQYFGFHVQEDYVVPSSELHMWSLLRPASTIDHAMAP